jgi:hypothetical protein
LTPYQDESVNALYLQSTTIIPLPGEEEYTVQVGSKKIPVGSSTLGEKLTRTFARNRSDDVTRFFRRVRELVLSNVTGSAKPDKHSRWAGDSGYYRYYKFWFKRSPWQNWGFAYAANLYSGDNGTAEWRALVGLEFWNASPALRTRIEGLNVHENQNLNEHSLMVAHTSDDLNDEFADSIAETFRRCIESITPVVDTFMEEEANQENA